MNGYEVLAESSTNEPWSDVSSREACQKMTQLLIALTNTPSSGISILKEQLKPFDIKDVAWNTEYRPLMEKVHSVWELGSVDSLDTHELRQFYGLVLGAPSVKLPFITTIGEKNVSWFNQRPNTESWTSVQENTLRPIEDADERFARNLLYNNEWWGGGDANGMPFFGRCTQTLPVYIPPWGKRTLTVPRREELENIINAGTVLGPRHDTTKQIIQQWIQNLRRRYRRKSTRDSLDTVANDL